MNLNWPYSKPRGSEPQGTRLAAPKSWQSGLAMRPFIINKLYATINNIYSQAERITSTMTEDWLHMYVVWTRVKRMIFLAQEPFLNSESSSKTKSCNMSQ